METKVYKITMSKSKYKTILFENKFYNNFILK